MNWHLIASAITLILWVAGIAAWMEVFRYIAGL